MDAGEERQSLHDFLTEGLPDPIAIPPDYADPQFALLSIGGWCKYACRYLDSSYLTVFWVCEARNGYQCPEPRCRLGKVREGRVCK